MNNPRILLPRIVFTLALTLSALGVSATTALAAPPDKHEFTVSASNILIGVCSFSVNVDSTVSGTETVFFDESGALTRIYQHSTEQDTFTASGKTLVGIPYGYNTDFLFDSSGNVTHVYTEGVMQRIPLPDGSLFVSAGRIDFVEHGPGLTFILSPDKGNLGNLAGFCAALAL